MTVKKVCRVCGKEYEACNCKSKAIGVFRWQDVACSPTCGSIYLEQIIASRAKDTASTKKVAAENDVGTDKEAAEKETHKVSNGVYKEVE